MKDKWNITTSHHHCFWVRTDEYPYKCDHEENSTYCAEDYCPIKQPPNQVDAVCACGYNNTINKNGYIARCLKCDKQLEQD